MIFVIFCKKKISYIWLIKCIRREKMCVRDGKKVNIIHKYKHLFLCHAFYGEKKRILKKGIKMNIRGESINKRITRGCIYYISFVTCKK